MSSLWDPPAGKLSDSVSFLSGSMAVVWSFLSVWRAAGFWISVAEVDVTATCSVSWWARADTSLDSIWQKIRWVWLMISKGRVWCFSAQPHGWTTNWFVLQLLSELMLSKINHHVLTKEFNNNVVEIKNTWQLWNIQFCLNRRH